VFPANTDPTVMMFGSSHCLHWAAVFEQVAAKEGTAVAFCCMDSAPGSFANAASRKAVIMKAARIASVKTIVWADFWGWSNHNYASHDFGKELQLLFSTGDDKRVILFGDAPTLSWSGSTSNQIYQNRGNLGFLTTQQEGPQYRKRRTDTEAKLRRIAEDKTSSWAGRVTYVETASYFEKLVQVGGDMKYYLQIVDPITGRLTHKDIDHLNKDGALRVEPIIRREVFSRSLC